MTEEWSTRCSEGLKKGREANEAQGLSLEKATKVTDSIIDKVLSELVKAFPEQEEGLRKRVSEMLIEEQVLPWTQRVQELETN